MIPQVALVPGKARLAEVQPVVQPLLGEGPKAGGGPAGIDPGSPPDIGLGGRQERLSVALPDERFTSQPAGRVVVPGLPLPARRLSDPRRGPWPAPPAHCVNSAAVVLRSSSHRCTSWGSNRRNRPTRIDGGPSRRKRHW